MTLTRREWLAATAVAGIVPPVPAAPTPAVIDTHTHFYDPTRPGGVPWPGKDDKVLYRPVLPAEYRKMAAPLGVTGTVVVEASPLVEDNQWLLDLAKDEPFLLGIVGRLIPTDADFAKNLDRFAKNPLFRGIRNAHAEVKKALADDAVLKNLARLAEKDLALDVNGGPELLADVAKLAAKLPKLRIVVNHMANPTIDGKKAAEEYVANLKAAARPNVWCKLSALVEGSRKRGAAPKDLDFYRQTADAVWNAFGADRVVFGSNWPVSDHYASFDTVFSLAKRYLTEKGAADKVFGANAVAAYKLTRK
ncbi:MAG: amidohydrolase family protein [Planctomycetia bacterium]|nr:amidohydrolase family protein [Planctomycetia bacterium]